MEKKNILLVEDDENLGNLLKNYLVAKDFNVHLYADGEKGFKAFIDNPFDVCILDIMMPIKDGFTLAKEIRAINSDIPVLFLTAKSLKEDILEGFKIGADDYITKPFNMEELLARIEAVLRRSKKDIESVKEVIEIGRYRFDTIKQLLQINNKEQKLTTKESELLKLLCKHKNQVLDRDFALTVIWLHATYFNARSMDVYITKLRKYLKEDPNLEIINVHGKGFKLIES
ncbi:response regulator transcription factor [Bacteroidota bacterium]